MPHSKNWNTRSLRYAVSAPSLDVDIVEDHTVLLEGLAVWLEDNTEGIRVIGRYSSWAELVPHLTDLSDVVILDVLLGDSIPLPAKIRALVSAGPQVVVCSSVTDPAVVRQAYASGALAYIPKTAQAHTVETALRAAAQGRVYVPEAVAAALRTGTDAPELTAREHQVASIYFSGNGPTRAEAGQILGISADGVKKHLDSIRRKFQDSDDPLSRLALRQRLIDGGWLHE